jgi:dolichol-phosphate mannosyltransferase
MLRLDLRDITAGYRAYRASTLREVLTEPVHSAGYCFQIDMTRRVARAGLTITEVPILFTERTVGTSKMTGSIVIEAMFRVTIWGIRDRLELLLPGRARSLRQAAARSSVSRIV